jgi:hypothetical protein
MEGTKVIDHYNDGTYSFTLTIYDEAFDDEAFDGGSTDIVSGFFEDRDQCEKAAARVAEDLNIQLR